MKKAAAQYTSSVLTKMANFFCTTLCLSWLNMPEPPDELVTKSE